MLATSLREGTESKREVAEVVRSVDEWLMNMDMVNILKSRWLLAPDNLARQPANQEIP